MSENKQTETHKNQHYLPESYIKFFRCEDADSGTSPYVFNKLIATSKQRKKGFIISKAKNFCYEKERHTFYLDGERELLIEECFNVIENTHADFIFLIRDYYEFIRKFECESIRNKGYCALSNRKEHFNILNIKNIYFDRKKIQAGIVEVNNHTISSIVTLYLKILIFRNKKFDMELKEKVDFKLKAIVSAIKGVESECFNLFGTNVITDKEKNDLLEMTMLFSKENSNLTLDKLREIREMYRKIHRYIISPIVHDDFSFRESKLYIFITSEKYPIVGGDAPFIMKKNHVIVTLTPSVAVIFSKNKLSIKNITIKNLSDYICRSNVSNANEFVFSKNKNRLIEYTKNINPPEKFEINNQRDVKNKEIKKE